MWKYVTRRLKETLDRTYCLVDSAKTWACGVQQQQVSNPSECDFSTAFENKDENTKYRRDAVKNVGNNIPPFGPEIFLPQRVKFTSSCCQKYFGNKTSGSSSNNSDKDKKNRKNFTEPPNQLHNDLLGALTWSGALVCGWYATQIYSMRRTRIGVENNIHDQKYYKYFQIPKRAIHLSVINSRLAFAAPIPYPTPASNNVSSVPRTHISSTSSDSSLDSLFASNDTFDNISLLDSYDLQNLEDISFGQKLTYDDAPPKIKLASNSSKSNSDGSANSSSSNRQSVSEAVTDLVNYIGECEYNMALEYLRLGKYRSAVVHLKLATSHHHPGGIFNLGICYENGLGVRKSLRRAMECYQMASGLGHATAMYNLGVFYAQGLGGLQKDKNAAKKCIITAAKLGQPDAKSFLTMMAVNDEEIAEFLNTENEIRSSIDSGNETSSSVSRSSFSF